MIEYVIRYSDGGREVITERITEFSDEVLHVISNADEMRTMSREDWELALINAKIAAVEDAGMQLRFEATPNDPLVLLRTGDVFEQLVG